MQIETHPWCPQNKSTGTPMQSETHPWCPQNKAAATEMQIETRVHQKHQHVIYVGSLLFPTIILSALNL